MSRGGVARELARRALDEAEPLESVPDLCGQALRHRGYSVSGRRGVPRRKVRSHGGRFPGLMPVKLPVRGWGAQVIWSSLESTTLLIPNGDG